LIRSTDEAALPAKFALGADQEPRSCSGATPQDGSALFSDATHFFRASRSGGKEHPSARARTRTPVSGERVLKRTIDDRLTNSEDLREKADLLLPGAEQLALLAKAKMFEAQVGMNALFNVQP
jgi:hypothetical protein